MQASASDRIELTTTNDGYVTRAAVQAGDVLLVERPLFVTPHWDCEQMKCSNCMLDSFIMCKKCQMFPLCIDCTTHDAGDCALFAAGGAAATVNKNLLVKNYAMYALLKLLLLLEHETDTQRRAKCETLLLRAQQTPQMPATLAQAEQRATVIAPLLQSGLLAQLKCVAVDEDMLLRLCHVIDVHAFELLNREGESLKGVYVHAAAHMPHSCVPNVCIAIEEQQYEMHVYAATAMPQGAALYNCYANPLTSTAQRQLQLRLSRGATACCTCARCTDASELGTHMSTLRCTQCSDGLLLPPVAATAAATDTAWTCTRCSATLPSATVQQQLDEMSDAFACVAGDLQATEELLCQYAARLHPQHFLLVEMKQHLASLLRALPLLGVGAEASLQLLRRRVRLCIELLPLVRVVQPGISKLYAIALYEYLLALRQLSELEHRQGLISEIDYGHKLLEAKHLSTEAQHLLRFEPPNSPEGHLAQRVAHEAKQITERLQHLNITEI